MKNPSKAQYQAIMHLEGPAQVIAGPGSGKTYTIVQRILHLIRQHSIKPEEILVITFTRAAALEMKKRCRELEAQNLIRNTDSIVFGTFHSICYRILSQSGMLQGKSLIQESYKKKILSSALAGNGYGESCCAEDINSILSYISRKKNCGGNLEELLCCLSFDPSVEEMNTVLSEYAVLVKERNLFDYDDLLLKGLEALKRYPFICRRYQEQFRYILADEFQDINPPQYEFLRLLASPQNNLFVVGDDDQAIYGFRGAAPDIMRQFFADYPQAARFMLTENYRSREKIVVFASRVISENKERFPKEFTACQKGGTIRSQCFLLRKQEEEKLILDLKTFKSDLNHSALIVRTNSEVRQYCELLKKAGLSVNGKGKTQMWAEFLREDISSFLRYLYEGNRRIDFLSFCNKPDRGISSLALGQETVSRRELMEYYKTDKSMCREISSLFAKLEIARGLSPFWAITYFHNVLEYNAYLKTKAADQQQYESWLSDCRRIREGFAKMELKDTVDTFWEHLSKGSAPAEFPSREGVQVLTMHGAKGLEFKNVYLPDLNEGMIPSKRCITQETLEEERRLLYVAITRARENLFLYYTQERNRNLSRFLAGIIPPP